MLMMKEKENSTESEGRMAWVENKNDLSDGKSRNSGNPDEKMGFQEKDHDFLVASAEKMVRNFDGAASESKKTGSAGFQELTLSYLCDNSKDGVSGKNFLNSLEKMGCNISTYKGKEIMVSGDQNEENHLWVERDFLCLTEDRGNPCKRLVEEHGENEADNREKKPKIETLNLSLALPDISLSLAGSNRVQNGDIPSQNGDFPARLRPSRSVQSLEPSNNNTRRTYSNDFTAASMSYSYSHPFSHNPSCSLTRNSTENYEYSVGSHRRDDHLWNAGEGTNGSVHSRFRPIGDGTVSLSNHGPGAFAFCNRATNKDGGGNSHYRATSSDNHSLFPSELPARPRMDTHSGDSRGRASENLRGLENFDGGRTPRKLSRPERILREIVSEPISVVAQIIQELPEETMQSTEEYLNNLISKPDRKDELTTLQNRLERRADLTTETLSKATKKQLDILVAIKMGLGAYLSSKISLPAAELVEIFLLERCRNINCNRLLPVDDCDCKICSTKKGFCSECMCPVCLNFDCAANTCSWVGCDVCSHWCHATCGIEKNLIRPGSSLKGPSVQFNCLGCDHASEMYGFVKDVFLSCARDWGLETLMKELDCVRKIFRGSEDLKGKELHVKADEMLGKLRSKIMSPSDVCNLISQFFSYADGFSDFASSTTPSKDITGQVPVRNEVAALPPSNSLLPSSCLYGKDFMPVDIHQNELKASLTNNKMIEDEWSVKLPKKDGFDSLESIVRVKEAEARMFQNRADEARRDASGFKRMIRIKGEKLEEEYSEKLAKLCLQETEERRRKRLEELKILENSHCDYYKMKMRMQAEIAGLLKRMEATKQQLV